MGEVLLRSVDMKERVVFHVGATFILVVLINPLVVVELFLHQNT